MSLIKPTIKAIVGFFISIGAVIAMYLVASVAGAYWVRSPEHPIALVPKTQEREIYILSSLLHADFVLPNDPYVLEKLSFLNESSLDFDHPAFRNLVIGWGSKTFYPMASELTNVTPAATFTAITGDQSVMHAVAFGEISGFENLQKLKLSETQFEHLVDFIADSFLQNETGDAVWLEGVSHGYGDVFYDAKGGFNILNPCNIWVADALHHAGLNIGRWTPTTYSLRLSLEHFGE